MKVSNFKKLVMTSLILGMMTGCLNKARQTESMKQNFEINNQETLLMLSSSTHKEEASALTVFYIPETGEQPGLDMADLDAEQLERRRKIARTIIDNSSAIDKHVSIAKRAGAFLQSEKTQCVSILTGFACIKGKDEMEAGFKQIEAKQAEIDAGQAQLDGKKAEAEAGLALINDGLGQIEGGLKQINCEEKEQQYKALNCEENKENENCIALNGALAKCEELTGKRAVLLKKKEATEVALNVTIPVKQETINAGQLLLDGKLKMLMEKKEICEKVLSKWEELKPFHSNISACAEKKAILDSNKEKAQELGKEIVMAVGPQNWMNTNPAGSSLVFGEKGIEIVLEFGLPESQRYSTEDNSIKNVTFDQRANKLKFDIEEKDQEGNFTGAVVKASLERTAIDNVHRYTGSIKRYESDKLNAEGKMKLEFEIQ